MTSYRKPPLSYRVDHALRAGFWWNIEKRIPFDRSGRDRYDHLAASVYVRRKRAEERAQATRRLAASGTWRVGPFVVCGDRTMGWFWLFGYGLWWKDRSRHTLYFSERNWHHPFDFAIGTWHFRILRRAGTHRDSPAA